MRKLVIALVGVVLLGGVGTVLLVSRMSAANGLGTPTPSKLECVEDGTPRDLVGCIRNEEVQWYWTFSGLEPRLGGATAKLLAIKESIEPMLLDVLLDKGKFAAAHVLLTYRSTGAFIEVEGEWNGLQVDLLADGQVSYEGNDLAKLHEYWEKKLQH